MINIELKKCCIDCENLKIDVDYDRIEMGLKDVVCCVVDCEHSHVCKTYLESVSPTISQIVEY